MPTTKLENNFMKKGAKKLKQFINAKGLTWGDMADLCNVSRQTIYNLMRGSKHNPTMRTLKNIETATGGAIKMEDWS